jgi:hypothetical protein
MKISIVNMIQPSLSGETNHDTEPNIAVNPVNVQQIAGTAFSPDPMGGSQGPVYRSTSEGNTWDEPDFLATQTADQTLRFAGNSNRLYVSYLDAFIAPNPVSLHIILKADLTANGLGSEINTLLGSYPSNYFDQPYIQAYSVMGGSGVNTDRVYVGGNHHGLTRTPAAIIQSMDAGAASPVFNEFIIESRVVNRNGPQVRIAAHLDGTIYATFYSFTGTAGSNTVADVVIVRDNNWGNVATPYQDLKDTDTKAGKKIVTGVQFLWGYNVGNQRTAGDMSIAVDPRDSKIVYVAWAELLSGVYTIHLMRSSDSGVHWSADLLPITNATHPCLTVNSHGKIGYLYQQVTGTGASQRWETHFRTSDDGTTWDDLVLCSAFLSSPGNPPNSIFGLGDYTHIMAAGKNFYGIFPADNTPDLTNFPSTATVTYNRNHNFVTKQLLANDGITVVNSSVDPFFFKIEELAPEKDFYLRDWTNSATDHDLGQEPSTYPWFYLKSDVWNRNANNPGPIVDDWYAGDDPNAGSGAAGDNNAFARINRNATGTKESVDIEFLSSDYGLGIPYSSVGSQTIKFNKNDLSKLTKGQPWHLDPSASTHACLAAQINTTDDPLILPGLSGNVPGWPFPDLLVINDNNKAQRNLHVNHVVMGMDGLTIMRVRNAALFTRDMYIRYDVPEIQWPFPRSSVEVTGKEGKPFRSGGSITLTNMKPGENRWVIFSFESVGARKGLEIPVNFYEMNGNRVVNGCAAVLKSASIEEVVKSILKLQQSVLIRLKAIGIKIDDEVINITSRLRKLKSVKAHYLKNSSLFHDTLKEALKSLPSNNNKMMNIEKDLKVFASVSSGTLVKGLSAHSILLEKLDCLITMKLLAEGEPACILSNINWQISLFRTHDELLRLKSSKRMLESAEWFATRYPRGRVTNKAYGNLIKDSLPCLRETTSALSSIRSSLRDKLSRIEGSMGSLRSLQKAHYDFLLLISDYFE